MKAHFENISVSSIAAYLPAKRVNLEQFSEWFGADEATRIAASTGVSEVRYAADDECTSDLCFNAAKKLLTETEMKAQDIDALIFVTQTPDYKIPGNSFLLQKKLGLKTECFCMDIPVGCSGYIYGLFQAALMVSQGMVTRVLLLAGETNSKMIASDDRSLRMVFGDAGTATLVEKGNSDMTFELMADGSGYEALCINEGGYRNPISNNANLFMDGMEVMNFALKEVPPMIERILASRSWQKDEVFYGLHQANAFMINYLRKKMNLPSTHVPVKMESTGNTGPASIPLMLCSLQSDEPAKQFLNRTILCGFGVGLSWAACSTDLSKTRFIAA